MSKKIILTLIILVVVAVGFGYWYFSKNEKAEFELEEVKTGTVVRRVSETGAVKISEKVNLSFENTGKIKEIYVKVGDKVSAGQKLAKLDTQQLYIELQEAKAALEVAKADYDKLLAGSSEEEIRVAEAEVLNAQVVLDNARQKLKDVKVDAEEDLSQAYQDAFDVLEDVYLKTYNAYIVADNIKRSYFSFLTQEGVKVQENVDIIKNAKNAAKSYLETEDIDAALAEVREALSSVRDALEVIRDTTETAVYRDTVPDSDKTSLDNQKTYINTAYSDVISAQQTISTTKITNQKNINDAQADVSSAEVKLQKAEKELVLKKAGPTLEEINLYQAKIKQAETKVSLLENKIQEAVLKSPAEGQIIAIEKEIGEMVQATDPVISLLPEGEFLVEVDIYEEDIINIKKGNPVEISLPAFPDETLKGKVVTIDPAEKIIDGVVYYEVNISFIDTKEGIKPGMTADIVIETAKKENVLVIPKRVVKRNNGAKLVRVFKNGQIEEREIEIGLEGDEYIEVISGLQEGEEVVITEKKR